jgi:hypothetical protein
MKKKLTQFRKVALTALFLIPLLSTVSFGQNISVTATVDKNRLTLEDTLQLSIVIQGTQNTPPPELPSLPDFQITSAGTSSSTQYINTQRSVSITHNYRLTPMNSGTIVIGPARVRANGKTYSTQPITIEVIKPSSSGTIENKTAFIETALSSKKAFVGEQLVYTFRLFHRVEAKNLDLKLPFDKMWFNKEELGEPKPYTRVVNGLQYNVQELSIALFPLKKGLAEIPPAILELDLLYRTQNRSGRDPFSQLFNDPFFGRGIRTEHKVLRSQPLSVEILPLPDGAPKGYKNLIGIFKISAELGKKDLEVGDTTTLTVTVSGQGNVRDISFEVPDLKNQFKVYPDKPEFNQTIYNNQIRGEKVFKFALVPLQAGNKTLPKFSLPYFDPENAQYRLAETQPVTLNVRPSSVKEELNLVQSGQQNPPMAKPEIETLGTDILPIYTELDKFQSYGSYSSAFMGVGFGAPAILFIFSAFLIKWQKRMKYDVAYYRHRNACKNARQRFKHISEHSDSKELGREISEVLREYIGDKLNLQGRAITAKEVEVHLNKSNCETGHAERTRKLLEKCETLQYAPMTPGNTKELLVESENLIKVLEKQL